MSENTMTNFLTEIIDQDLASGRVKKIHTRFPPEPNGYLHIGHAKAVCINFLLAKQYGGLTNLRFDDTNPAKEDTEYVDAIMEDIKWLGFDWDDRLYYASDYFDKFYEYAVLLIKKGKAYVCDLTAERTKEYRGTLTEPGKDSPYRDRSIEDNLDLFERMKNGEFPNGAKVLRAKIDMASPNQNMRDPVIYRILHQEHHHVGNQWCIYPMYDYAHPLEDAIESITHSMCSLEFENHRPLYDWVIENVGFENPPHQYEFARLNLTHTVMSKRYLRELVETGLVDGWDDPRMPTLCGMRRRGYTPSSIIEFIKLAGISKSNSIVDLGLLEHCVRDELNKTSSRAMAVLEPLKVIIEDYPEDKEEYFPVTNNPEDEAAGKREVPFSREIYIERSDFMEEPPGKWFRLAPGKEVRLIGAYFITCKEIVKDENGNVTALICTHDPASSGGNSPDGRKVKGTMHWVSAKHCLDVKVRIFDNLFTLANPADMPEDKEYKDFINPDSAIELAGCKLEPSLAKATTADRFQFVRSGYFCRDSKNPEVFNRIVTLKDTFKI